MEDGLDGGLHLDSQQTESIIKSLEDIRDKLVKANTVTGALARYNGMKQEISEHGWSFICSKYHPDINIGEPAAHEIFQMYKFVYETMGRQSG
jgi:hypothetical protein